MKVAVLNGSPKGANSVTMQYVKYLAKAFPGVSFEIHNVAQKIRSIEKKQHRLQEIAENVRESDLVLWAFPLYYMLCCSQYKRFIELVFENQTAAFKDKPAAVLTTSINFYDHTAINYLRGICDDFQMPFCGYYSAEMSDLFNVHERNRFENFFNSVVSRIEESRFYPSVNNPTGQISLVYKPLLKGEKKNPSIGKLLVIADFKDAGSNLKKMVETFVAATGSETEVVDLSSMEIPGCTGCCRCAFDNQCIFGEDDYIKLHSEKVSKADAIVFAGEIRDRYLSAEIKKFFDRSFYKGHTPSLKGRQVGFLISGRLREQKNLQEILRSWVEMQQCGFAGFVTDEVETSNELDHAIGDLVKSLAAGIDSGYIPPPTYRYVGGAKLFRDFIWGQMRPVFQADHRYYRKNGLYDFPQKRVGLLLFNTFVGPLLRLPFVKKQMIENMPGAMLQRFKRIVS